MSDSIIETKICPISDKEFSITQGDLDFYNKISPILAGQKFQIPTPTLCPDERQRRRLSFRNERNLYKRKCDASGKDIISIYSPDKPYKVYDQKIRRSDSRDPLSYGQDFDFSKTFTENFRELMQKVPLCSILNINSENSEYTNLCANNQNCYMIIESSNNKDSYYSYRIQKSRDIVDCSMTNLSSLCYNSSDLDNCHKLFFSYYCRECSNSYFLNNCINCSFCFGCSNIEGKQYRIFNKENSKEEFENIIQILQGTDNGQKTTLLEKIAEQKSDHNTNHIRNSNNASGDYIIDSESIVMSYEIYDARNVAYSKHVWFNSGDCYDVDTVGYNSFLMYESINTALDAYNNKCCIRCRSGCQNLLYCFNCDSCSDCFGCTGLRNKSYCIFNKQYTKEEYEIQVAKIITHMIETKERGEFFHPSLSPFGYNETVAQEHFPTSKGELKQYGYNRSDYQSPAPIADKVIEGSKLPASINEVSDDILKTAIRCEVTGKLFRVIPQELAFYRKHHIPLPRRHPDQRHLDRLALRK